MMRWATEILAIDPNSDRGIVKWEGPNIEAETHEEAERYCQENGLGYCKVLGELVCEVPWCLAEFTNELYTNREN